MEAEVLREDFQSKLPRFKSELQKPSLEFISFDFEMSGIMTPNVSFAAANAYDDLPEDRYAKVRAVATRYSVVQLGVALFHRNGPQHLQCSVWDFNLLKESEDTVLSPSSMRFLVQHSFDLNDWIKHGIPFVDAEGKKQIQDALAEDLAEIDSELGLGENKGGGILAATSDSGNKVILEKEADQAVVADVLAQVDEWLSTSSHEARDNKDEAPPEIILPPLEWAGIRKYIYQEIQSNQKYKRHGLITEKRGRNTIAVLRPSHEQRQQRRREKREKLRVEADRKIGARFIYEALSEACQGGPEREPIPLVGHNCFLDLCFLQSSFDVLPEGYEDWKAILHKAFPLIIDTKHVAAFGAASNWWPWSSTSLEALYEEHCHMKSEEDLSSSSSPTFSSSSSPAQLIHQSPHAIDITYTSDKSSAANEAVQHFHDAGWDAFCTGCVLTRLGEKTLSRSTSKLVSSIDEVQKDVEKNDGAKDGDEVPANDTKIATVRQRLKKTKAGKASVAEKTSISSNLSEAVTTARQKPKENELVSISAVCALSQLISPRNKARKNDKEVRTQGEASGSSNPAHPPPQWQNSPHGLLCELPLNELNLMRSPFVIALGKPVDVRRDGTVVSTVKTSNALPSSSSSASATTTTTSALMNEEQIEPVPTVRSKRRREDDPEGDNKMRTDKDSSPPQQKPRIISY